MLLFHLPVGWVANASGKVLQGRPPQKSQYKDYMYSKTLAKVLSLLEACFYLISGSSISMKIQIMGEKITENSKVQISALEGQSFCSFFFSFSFSSLFLTI